MTKSDFAEMIEFIRAQWPDSTPWGQASIETTYTLVANVDAGDAWSGIFDVHATGPKWPPQPAEIVKAIKERAQERNVYRPTPPPALESGSLTLTEYLQLRGYGSLEEAIEATAKAS